MSPNQAYLADRVDELEASVADGQDYLLDDVFFGFADFLNGFLGGFRSFELFY